MSDNHRYISPSEIASMDCWRAYRWKRAGIRPRRKPKALNAGIAWDAFMGEWFRPIGVFGDMLRDERTIEQRLDDGLTAALAEVDKAAKQADEQFVRLYGEGSRDVEEERFEIEALIRGMAIHFADTFDEAENGVCRAVQVSVDAPLPSQSGEGVSNKYRLHGKIDRLMERRGELVLVDDKTAGMIEDTFFDDFQNDLQMPLYAYGLPKSQALVDLGMAGCVVGTIAVFAAAKKLPVVPPMRKTPFPVYATNGIGEVIHELDDETGDMKPVQLTEPVLDEDGNEVLFKSGPRKGQVKTSKVTRAGLASLLSGDGSLNYTTTLEHFRQAIAENGLEITDYERELDFLADQGVKPFFQLAEIPVSPTMRQEAAEVLRSVAPWLDKVPDAPMRNKFRCKRCPYQEACVIADPQSREDAIKILYSTREERAEQAKAAAAATHTPESETTA